MILFPAAIRDDKRKTNKCQIILKIGANDFTNLFCDILIFSVTLIQINQFYLSFFFKQKKNPQYHQVFNI